MNEHLPVIEQEFEVGAYQCSFCDKWYKSVKSLRAHMKCHTGEGYQCSYCFTFCTAPSTLERHMKTHREQQTCSCVVCDREFVAPKNLKWHIRAVHGGDVNILTKSLGDEYRGTDLSSAFQCQFCDKSYAQIKSLRKHLVSVHGHSGQHIVITTATTSKNYSSTSDSIPVNNSFVFYPKDDDEDDDDDEEGSVNDGSTAEVLYTCDLCSDSQLYSTLESVVEHMQSHQEVTISASAVNTETLTASTVNTETLTSSAVNTETLTASAVNTEKLTASIVNTETLSASTENTETFTGSTVNTETLTGSTVNTETVTGSTVNTETLMASTENIETVTTSTENIETLIPSMEPTETLTFSSTGNIETLIVSPEHIAKQSASTESVDELTEPQDSVEMQTTSTENVGTLSTSTKSSQTFQILQESSKQDKTCVQNSQVSCVEDSDSLLHSVSSSNSIVSLNQTHSCTVSDKVKVDSTTQSSTYLALSESNDDSSDFSDGYEEMDDVGVGGAVAAEAESVYIKQEVQESSTLLSGHQLGGDLSRLGNEYSMLGYNKNLHILDVKEFQCNGACSVKVLEVDARDVSDQGFIDIFVIKNENPPQPDDVNNADAIDSVLNAIVKHENFQSLPDSNHSPAIIQGGEEGQTTRISHSRHTVTIKKASRDRKGTVLNCRCTTCGRCFESREALYYHKKTVHIKSNNRFKCELCRNTYQTWSYLRKHRQRVHYNKEKATFKCSYCPEAFPQRHMLRMHIKKHTGQKDHVCDVCNKRFAELFVLNAHRKLVHFPEKLYECAECQKKYKSLAGLKKHMFTHTSDRTFTCKCGKTFSNPDSLIYHEKLHSDVRPFVCDRCSKGFVMKATLKKHIKRVHDNVKRADIVKKPYVCDCGKRFAVESYLKNHIACYHTELKPHVCHVCFKCFAKRFLLNKHLKKEHPGSVPQKGDDVPKQTFPCEDCGKKFISLYHFNRHQKKFHPEEDQSSDVESEKPSVFVCHCGKEFSQERYLKCHLIVHDNMKPFKCETCDKSFSKLFKLNKHVKHVHMKKPKPVDPNKRFVCECGKRFSNKRNLTCHMITHQPRTEFKCPVCGKNFGARYLLNKHMRRVHEEDPNDYSEHFT